MIRVEMPWPSSILSGHAKRNGDYAKRAVTKRLRAEAKQLAIRAGVVAFPAKGDIPITIRFEPPNNRGDRVNFPNRAKPIIDGVADAWGVNDKRFLPTWEYGQLHPPHGRVVVEVAL